MAEPSSRNQIRAGSLRIVDPDGQPYDGAWLGMADDVQGSDPWLRLGGIGDQGFSVFGASVAPNMLPPAAHMNDANVIPQHVVVHVDEVAVDHVSGTAYTSESYGPNEGDNRTLFTVVVLGKPAKAV